MELITKKSKDTDEPEKDEHQDKDRSDLNKVPGHQTFDYEYMLKKIAD